MLSVSRPEGLRFVVGRKNSVRRGGTQKRSESCTGRVFFATSRQKEGLGGGGVSIGQEVPAVKTKRKFDGISQLLNQVVTATSIPYVTYVPLPRSPLHFVDARVKQILAFACLVAAARGTLEVRFAMCLGVGAASLLCLPKSYSLKQVLGVVKLCFVVGIFTLLAADAVNVPIQERMPTDAIMGGVEALKDHTTYKYTLLNLGIFKITRRSVNLAAAACALQTFPRTSMPLLLSRALPFGPRRVLF